MMGNPWIYSAVLWGVLVGMLGAGVGVYAVRKVSQNDDPTTASPALVWLIVGMACVALATALEQSRVLIYRMAYDGLIDRAAFDLVYDLTAYVAGTKVLAAVAIAGSSAVLAALLRARADADALRWGLVAGLATAAGWLGLSLVLLALF